MIHDILRIADRSGVKYLQQEAAAFLMILHFYVTKITLRSTQIEFDMSPKSSYDYQYKFRFIVHKRPVSRTSKIF